MWKWWRTRFTRSTWQRSELTDVPKERSVKNNQRCANEWCGPNRILDLSATITYCIIEIFSVLIPNLPLLLRIFSKASSWFHKNEDWQRILRYPISLSNFEVVGLPNALNRHHDLEIGAPLSLHSGRSSKIFVYINSLQSRDYTMTSALGSTEFVLVRDVLDRIL